MIYTVEARDCPNERRTTNFKRRLSKEVGCRAISDWHPITAKSMVPSGLSTGSNRDQFPQADFSGLTARWPTGLLPVSRQTGNRSPTRIPQLLSGRHDRCSRRPRSLNPNSRAKRLPSQTGPASAPSCPSSTLMSVTSSIAFFKSLACHSSAGVL